MAFVQSLLKRTIWKVLPVDFRRQLLSNITSFLAPKIDKEPQPRLPIIVVGTFRSATGLGQSARLSYLALKNVGVPVKAIDITKELSQPIDLDFPVDPTGNETIEGTLLLHVNAPLVPLALMKLGKNFIKNKYIVGYWAWELPALPKDWNAGFKCVHEVWGPSKFTCSAISKAAGAIPVRVLAHPVTQDWPSARNQRASGNVDFSVTMVFNIASGFTRKNPIAAIAAFKLAFGNDTAVHFTIKTINADHYPEGMNLLKSAIGNSANITLESSYLDAGQMAALYQSTDVIISLHRAEGFGLTIAEGMLHGKVVVATDWSGNKDFMNKNTAMPISYQLIEAVDPQNTYNFPDLNWANPNVDEAAEALRHLRQNPEFRKAIGKAAAKHSKLHFSTETYAKAVLSHLEIEK